MTTKPQIYDRSFTGSNSDIPIPETGYTVMGGSYTVPCDKFLAVAHSASESWASLSQHSASQPSSVSSTSSRRYSGPPRPVFTDTNLVGCYAGTGALSTTYTFRRGDYFPRGTASDYPVASSDEVRTIACSDFMTLPYVDRTIALSYMKSPICTSQIQWGLEHPDAPTGYGQGPPGLFNHRPVGDPFECCGGCYFQLPTISILYFTTTPVTQCSRSNATVTSLSSPSAVSDKLEKRAAPLLDATNNVVVDGSTLTYPSIYLVLEGAVTVTDKCGLRGMVHNNPTIAIPPHGLTELSFSYGYHPQGGYQTLPYDPAVPANCRTYGFRNPQMTSGWYQVDVNSSYMKTSTQYAPGYPYHPFLVPPQQLIDLDPAWKTCRYWSTFGDPYGQLTYGAFDPPRLLNSATAMVPQSAPAAPTTESLPSNTPDPAAQPGAKSSPDAPRVTSSTPEVADPADHSNSIRPDAVASIMVPATDRNAQDKSAETPQQSAPLMPAPSLSALRSLPDQLGPTSAMDPRPSVPAIDKPQPEGHPDPSLQSLAPQDAALPPTKVQLGPHLDTALAPIQLQTYTNGQDAAYTGKKTESQVKEQGPAPVTYQIGNPTGGPPENPALGGLIYSAIGNLGPAASPNHAADLSLSPGNIVAKPSIVTANGQVLTVLDPSEVLIAGTTLTPGGDRLTVSEIPVNSAPLGNLLVGHNAVSRTLSVLAIPGHTTIANPTPLNAAGVPMIAGGPGVAMSTTAANSDHAGTPVIGGSNPKAPPAGIQPSTPNMLASVALPQSVFNIGDQAFAANPSGFSIAGTTISAGGPGVTISGTPVLLDTSGSLILGTNKIALAGSTTVPVNSNTDDPMLNADAGTGVGAVSPQVGALSGKSTLFAPGPGSSDSVGVGGSMNSGFENTKDTLANGSDRSTSTGDAGGGANTSIPSGSVASGTNAPSSDISTSTSTGGVVSGADVPIQTGSRASGTRSPGGTSKASGEVRSSGLIAMFVEMSMVISFT